MQQTFILETSSVIPTDEVLALCHPMGGKVPEIEGVWIRHIQTDNLHSKYTINIVKHQASKCFELGVRLSDLFSKYNIPMTKGNYAFG